MNSIKFSESSIKKNHSCSNLKYDFHAFGLMYIVWRKVLSYGHYNCLARKHHVLLILNAMHFIKKKTYTFMVKKNTIPFLICIMLISHYIKW